MTTESPRSTQPSDDRDALRLLRQMLRIRRFEEKCASSTAQQKIRGFLHLYIGEEAVAVGVMQALDAGRRRRRHLSRARPRAGARHRRRARSWRRCSARRRAAAAAAAARCTSSTPRTRFYGGNAIVGGGLPLAVGLALADKMQGRTRVTVCFFGDGAVAEGEFHESLNLAALWRLPVLFVCENNLYAMGTRARAHRVGDRHRRRRPRATASPALAVDGMDVARGRGGDARRASTAIRAGGGPYFLECRTYRFRAHSMYDPELYRDKAEVERLEEARPDHALRGAAARQRRCSTDDDVDAIEQRRRAPRSTRRSPSPRPARWEPVEDLTRFVYSEQRAP